MEYDVVIADCMAALVNAVQARIDEGWSPLGGAAVAAEDGIWEYAQAITRPERAVKPKE